MMGKNIYESYKDDLITAYQKAQISCMENPDREFELRDEYEHTYSGICHCGVCRIIEIPKKFTRRTFAKLIQELESESRYYEMIYGKER